MLEGLLAALFFGRFSEIVFGLEYLDNIPSEVFRALRYNTSKFLCTGGGLIGLTDSRVKVNGQTVLVSGPTEGAELGPNGVRLDSLSCPPSIDLFAGNPDRFFSIR